LQARWRAAPTLRHWPNSVYKLEAYVMKRHIRQCPSRKSALRKALPQTFPVTRCLALDQGASSSPQYSAAAFPRTIIETWTRREPTEGKQAITAHSVASDDVSRCCRWHVAQRRKRGRRGHACGRVRPPADLAVDALRHLGQPVSPLGTLRPVRFCLDCASKCPNGNGKNLTSVDPKGGGKNGCGSACRNSRSGCYARFHIRQPVSPLGTPRIYLLNRGAITRRKKSGD
jgi:hypothetical protein